uniref:Uncharacterized protein n=1 Tax=Saccharum officinarum TaxID=4547 RepID=A0A678T4M1_SACOF|nr:hypothetical protein SO155N20_000006 [Saccharum officinarum]
MDLRGPRHMARTSQAVTAISRPVASQITKGAGFNFYAVLRAPAATGGTRRGDPFLPRPAAAAAWFHSSPSGVPGDEGPLEVPKSKGIAATASQPSTPAFTAPAAPTTTTFNTGLDVNINSVQEVFDGMPMRKTTRPLVSMRLIPIEVVELES